MGAFYNNDESTRAAPDFAPSAPQAPASADPAMQRYTREMAELLERRSGLAGNALDRFVTVRELINSGVALRRKTTRSYNPNDSSSSSRGFSGGAQAYSYNSAQETLVNGALITLSHGLPATPTNIQLFLTCIVADGNYAVGDIVALEMGRHGASTGTAVVVGPAEIQIRQGAAGVGFILNKTTGASHTVTVSKFTVSIHASVVQ